MPLFAWSVLTYSATLIVALSVGAPARVLLGALALAACLGLHAAQRRTHALVSAVAAAGVLTATATVAHDAQCTRALVAPGQHWHADFDADAAPGDMAHVLLQRSDCAARATVFVVAGGVRGGQGASVTGRATAGTRGLLVEGATIVPEPNSVSFLSARAATGRRIDQIFRDDAPMARALVIADMSGIPIEQRDRYATAGLVHMLSVSGLHVGIVALALELLASILRLPVTPARVATLALLGVYVAAIGAPPPAVRAAVMLSAVLVCRLLQRPTSPWAILALGAVAPLWDPRTALDLGWQLSVAGTAALIAGGALATRVIPSTWGGWRRTLATGATVSIVATIVTAPLVAWAFGRVSLLGPITNLLADPVMALLQPLLFVALAIPVQAVDGMAADAAHALLSAFDGIARLAASVPYAAPHVLPTVAAALASGVSAIAVIVACLARHPARAVIVCAVGVTILVVEPLVPRVGGRAELHMIDVGQGDALALRTSKGNWIVVDAGRSWEGGDAGRSTVAPYLSRLGGTVSLFVLSHPHADHVGGAASLFALLHPLRFLDPGYVGTTPPYRAALASARALGIPWQRVHPGATLVVDDITLTALAPDSAWASHLTDANLASSVLVASVSGHRILFTGDAEAEEEEWLLEHSPDALRADVLKVAHHGSSTSTTRAFLDAVHPRIALVSVGAHNTYGHPDAGVLRDLAADGVATLRTDRLGTVVLRFDATGVEVTAHGEHWFMPNQVIR